MGREEEDILGLLLVGGLLFYGFKSGLIDKLLAQIEEGFSSIGSGGGSGKTDDSGGETSTDSGGEKPSSGTNTGGNTSSGSGAGITFAAAGDWGSGRNSNWKKVVAIMKSKGAKVVLVPGDMSYTNEGDFKPVTDAIKAFAKVLGAEGNHDGSGYGKLFNAYSNSVTTIGNVSFMSLNSNSEGSAISYAKSNLSKMTGLWKVVFFHHPVYTVKSNHGASMGALHSVIKGKVDLCIAAHNHNYQRFAVKDGVTYIVSGLGGEGAYKLGSNGSGNPSLAKGYNSQMGASIFTTSATSIKGSFVNVGGSTIDSFTITKAKAGLAKTIQMYQSHNAMIAENISAM